MNWKQIKRGGWKVQGTNLMLGNITVASVVYDVMTAKDNPEKFRADLFLPGLKSNHGYFSSQEGAQYYVENQVKGWLYAARLNDEGEVNETSYLTA